MSSLHLQRKGGRRGGGGGEERDREREREIKGKRRNKIQCGCEKNSGIYCGVRIDII